MATNIRERLNQLAGDFAPSPQAKAMEDRVTRIAQAKAALDAAQRALNDAHQGAALLAAERDRLNVGTPADSPQAFAERWKQLAALEGAIAASSAWIAFWRPKVDRLEADYRAAVSIQLPAFERAAAEELAPLQAEVERWRTHPMRGRADVAARYQEARKQYDAALNRWRETWNNRPQ